MCVILNTKKHYMGIKGAYTIPDSIAYIINILHADNDPGIPVITTYV